jgi:hypothetical protein
MRTFLSEQQAKGYITRSKLAWSSPFFYIKKQDGKLRPVYNYRKVNEWTVKGTDTTIFKSTWTASRLQQ